MRKSRSLARAHRWIPAVLTMLAATAMFVAQASASAASYHVFKNEATGRCLDSNFSGSVYALACNGGNYQKWVATYDSNLNFTLKNVATGLCLDSDYSGSVYTLHCNGGNYQKWSNSIDFLTRTEAMRDVQTGRYLDSSGGSVYTNPPYANNNQQWFG